LRGSARTDDKSTRASTSLSSSPMIALRKTKRHTQEELRRYLLVHGVRGIHQNKSTAGSEQRLLARCRGSGALGLFAQAPPQRGPWLWTHPTEPSSDAACVLFYVAGIIASPGR
jgi:hypothetical protein